MKKTAKTAAFLAIALLLPLTLAAHVLPQERSILVEVEDDSVRAMVVYQEPPGDRVGLLKTRFDFDGDGKLTGAEAEAAGDTWIPHALQGIKFEVPGIEAERRPPEIKFKNHHNGALSAAILLEWKVGEVEPGASRTVRVRRTTQGGQFATLLHFQSPEGLQFTDVPGEAAKAGDRLKVGPFKLQPGNSLSATVKRRAKTAAKAAPEDPRE